MATPHSSVNYVEPNDLFRFTEEISNVRGGVDRAPDLEDYCIALDIEVDLKSRMTVGTLDSAPRVLTVSWNSGKEEVRMMSGSRMIPSSWSDDGKTRNEYTSARFMTDRYADMWLDDVIDYGTTEMLGIKSVDIEYYMNVIPKIKVEFTDVRGMSIFAPRELQNEKEFQGILGIDSSNPVKTFFQCFFIEPKTKFRFYIKGFYGKPVAYETICSDFRSTFDSDTGGFNITAEFIGGTFSFLTDIPILALMAAPYSDYGGKGYWESNIKDRFKLKGKDGVENVPMPTLCELYCHFNTLVKKTTNEMKNSPLMEELVSHDEEIAKLTTLKDLYENWYESLLTSLRKEYDKYKVYAWRDAHGSYTKLILFTTSDGDSNMSKIYEKIGFSGINNELYGAVNEYNKTVSSLKQLPNVSNDFSAYKKVKIFNSIKKVPQSSEYKSAATYTAEFAKTAPLTDGDKVKDFYNNPRIASLYGDEGKNPYLYAYIINLDYSNIKKWINVYQQEANKGNTATEEQKIEDELNRLLLANMNWYPSVENFTKIMMAHLETFLSMMDKVITEIGSRTPSSVGVSVGKDGNASDVPSSSEFLPPFPRITREVEEDGITRKEDAWVGDFVLDGKGMSEVDIVNGLLNGIGRVNELVKLTEQVLEQYDRNTSINTDLARSVVKYPISTFDFYINKNPYHNPTENPSTFAAQVCARMFALLSLNFYRTSAWGWANTDNIKAIARLEAENFYDLNAMTNSSLNEMILGSGAFDGETLLKIVTNDSDPIMEAYKINGKYYPWSKNASLPLLNKSTMWMTRYEVKGKNGSKSTYVYPIQDYDFLDVENTCSALQSNTLPYSNANIAISNVPSTANVDFKAIINSNDSLYHSLVIDDVYNRIKTYVGIANGNGNDAYNQVLNLIKNCYNFSSTKDNITNVFEFNSPSIHNAHSICSAVGIKKNDEKYVPYILSSLIDVKNPNGLYIDEDGNTKAYVENPDTFLTSYLNSFEEETPNTAALTLTEVFGYDLNNKINTNYSLFLQYSYRNCAKSLWEKGGLGVTHMKAAKFVLGIKWMEMDSSVMFFKSSTMYPHVFMPRVLALQIGALCAACASVDPRRLYNGVIDTEKLRTLVPIDDSMMILTYKYVSRLSFASKMSYIKYFKSWVDMNFATINEKCKFKEVYEEKDYIEYRGKKYRAEHPEVFASYIFDKSVKYGEVEGDEKKNIVTRVVFNEDNQFVQELTNNLMWIVCVTHENANSILGTDLKPRTTNGLTFAYNDAKTYLDTFIGRLREMLSERQEMPSTVTRMAATPKRVNEDMKIELYRYLKQLYDKWYPMKSEEWKFENYFKETEYGHQFHFIDSYYNKIGDKLLLSPQKLNERIETAMYMRDYNAMMFNWMSSVYNDVRLMFLCIQNFNDLSKKDSMEEMFKPLPYNGIGNVKKHPDFVAIYTYEPSHYLDMGDSEHMDDGFMLNDEMDTPKPIRSRVEPKEDGDASWYRIPAFGVSYGRQYQSVFKKVSVGMDNPIATQQAIQAKLHIAGLDSKQKTTASQDLYDIYSTQSYTCNVEMMGCAWVQPMMYCVLTNIPMFKGSYMIMKVNHHMSQGDMVTTFSAQRMCNVSNRLVKNIFTTEDAAETEYEDIENVQSQLADIDNDCPYKIYPLFEEHSGKKMTKSQVEKGVAIMRMLIAKDSSKMTPILAASICGNMAEESNYFDPYAVNPDNTELTFGLCQWRDTSGNGRAATLLLENNYSTYGNKYTGTTYVPYTRSEKDTYIARFNKKIGTTSAAQYEVNFLYGSMTASGSYRADKLNKGGFWSSTTIEDATKKFNELYEGSNQDPTNRISYAKQVYNAYMNGGTAKDESTKNTTDLEKNIHVLLFNAVQQTCNSNDYTKCKLTMSVSNDRVLGQMEKVMNITQGDGKTDKLGKVFDILLNGYYEYVEQMYWVYANDTSDVFPRSIKVVPRLKVSPKDRRIFVVSHLNYQSDTQPSYVNGDSTEFSTNFTLPILKRYGPSLEALSKSSAARKELPQFNNNGIVTSKFSNAEVKACDSLLARGSWFENHVNGSTQKIGQWEIGKSIAYFKTNVPIKKKSKGECYKYVKRALYAGGFSTYNDIPAYTFTKKVSENPKSFKMIYDSGNYVNEIPNYGEKRVGDIMVFQYVPSVPYGHIDMYDGRDWVSDFRRADKKMPKRDVPSWIRVFRFPEDGEVW